MTGLLRNGGLFVPEAAPAPVLPTIIRVAQIGILTGGATGNWANNGTFDASGTEPNRALLIFSMPYDVTDTEAFVVNALTIGGTAAAVGGAPTVPADTRNVGDIIHYRLAPPNDAVLAVAWDFTGDADLVAGRVMGALLSGVHQTDPLPQINGARAAQGGPAEIDVAITTTNDKSLLIGCFAGRGADTHPFGTRNGSTIHNSAATGASNVLDIGSCLASLATDAAGAYTLSTVMSVGDAHAGRAVAVRPT